ncbi:amidohydrolase family protein [Maricaulis parjimensis]|uniref:amidohydrolase family protein n=1 Tax=Maricaulis parjimensis TaxID=144023 RepID=UPI00193A6F02|nr:amidohydrolase family protein [Maricaulis parjimensis]
MFDWMGRLAGGVWHAAMTRSLPLAMAGSALGAAVLMAGSVTPPLPAQEVAVETVLYRDAFVWTGAGFEQRDFAVAGERFVDPARVRADRVVTLDGQYVLPPFGEGHTHKFETEWTVQRFSPEMLRQGVFYARNPGAYAPNIARIRPLLATRDTVDVSFSMGGLTAPHGHPEGAYIEVMTQFWYSGFTREDFVGEAFHPVETRDEVEAAIARVQAQGADFVKIFLQNSDTHAERARLLADPDYRNARDYPDFDSIVGLDPALAAPAVQIAHARGLSVGAHVSNAADFRVAVEAGVDMILHMPGASWEPGYGLPSEVPAADVLALAAQRGIPVVATAAVRLNPEHQDVMDEVHHTVLAALHEAGVPIRIGIDNFGLTTRDEIDYQRAVGILDDLALIQAWIATGREIFPERAIGAIEPGFEASFLVLDADPLTDFSTLDRIVVRVKEGQVLELED